MRALLIRSGCLLPLLIASSASAVVIDWTFIGNPGNACEPQGAQGCFGAVGYYYNIGTYEVTNAQYAEFLNAKAASDPLQLYDTNMATFGGITRSGDAGSYTYSAIAGREDRPVNFVSFFDALRFANWMNNGQGSGDTETGAYTLLGGTEFPSNGATVTRNGGAAIFLTSEDEWYKAAYYNPSTASYFDYPAGSSPTTRPASPRRSKASSLPASMTKPSGTASRPSPEGGCSSSQECWAFSASLAGAGLAPSSRRTSPQRAVRRGLRDVAPVPRSATFPVAEA